MVGGIRKELKICTALSSGAARLRTAGVETPRLDAELLLAHALDRNRTYLFAHPQDLLSPEENMCYEAFLRRREAREPLPYVLGEWEFMGMRLEVSPAVLIPRPETETLVETAAGRLPPEARILDVGAGSGCISLGVARLLPGAGVVALEASVEAVTVARRNVGRVGYGDRVRVVHGSFPQAAEGLGPLDAVVSNPPYIASAEVDRLAPELRFYEPRQALDGGPDGLELIRLLVSESPRLLKPGGLLAMEIALGQAEQVCELLRSNAQWEQPEVVPDLGGVPRVLLARSGS